MPRLMARAPNAMRGTTARSACSAAGPTQAPLSAAVRAFAWKGLLATARAFAIWAEAATFARAFVRLSKFTVSTARVESVAAEEAPRVCAMATGISVPLRWRATCACPVSLETTASTSVRTRVFMACVTTEFAAPASATARKAIGEQRAARRVSGQTACHAAGMGTATLQTVYACVIATCRVASTLV